MAAPSFSINVARLQTPRTHETIIAGVELDNEEEEEEDEKVALSHDGG